MKLSRSPIYLDHTARPCETLGMGSGRTRRHILVSHHRPRIDIGAASSGEETRTNMLLVGPFVKRASNAIAATSVWRDVLSPFYFEANLAPTQLTRQSGCARTSSRRPFCFGWRNAEATFHLYTSTRNLHAPLDNVKQLYRLPSPAPHFDLVYFWLACLSDAATHTIVAILWSTITIP